MRDQTRRPRRARLASPFIEGRGAPHAGERTRSFTALRCLEGLAQMLGVVGEDIDAGLGAALAAIRHGAVLVDIQITSAGTAAKRHTPACDHRVFPALPDVVK